MNGEFKEMIAVPETVSFRQAAKVLQLRPRELALAEQLLEVPTVASQGRERRVPCAALQALTSAEGFPFGLRQRLHEVGLVGGAQVLNVTPARFDRLARGGCFSPVRFRLNRYGAVTWTYLVHELESFRSRRPDLLSGPLPVPLRAVLREGTDFRPRHWRSRRVSQLGRLAPGPWARAAARAAVLDAGTLLQAVPDSRERACLLGLRPSFLIGRQRSPVMRAVDTKLRVAFVGEELLWHRLLLSADLEDAREATSGRCVGEEAVGGRLRGPVGARGAGVGFLQGCLSRVSAATVPRMPRVAGTDLPA